LDGHAELIRVGHDLQRVDEVERRADALAEFFTTHELDHVERAREPRQTLAGLFCAKEALFKCLGSGLAYDWCDMEVSHDPAGAPSFRFGGALARHFAARGLCATLSISHSGDYASAVVVLFGALGSAAAARSES